VATWRPPARGHFRIPRLAGWLPVPATATLHPAVSAPLHCLSLPPTLSLSLCVIIGKAGWPHGASADGRDGASGCVRRTAGRTDRLEFPGTDRHTEREREVGIEADMDKHTRHMQLYKS
jgi:hypothetical protein